MKTWKSLLAVLSALALTAAVFAQSAAPRKIVIHAGRVLDVKSGQTLPDQAIYIEGDKITKVESAAGMQAASGWEVIELPNATVLPGLVDVHTHLTGDPYHFGYASLGISDARSALTGAKNAKSTLEAGFTTVRNVGASGFTDVALRDAINDGDIPGPRMLVSGPALSITGGHGDENLLPWDYHWTSDGVADGVEGVRHKVRENIKYGADVIKFMASGGVLSKGDNPQASQYTFAEMQAIVDEAHRLGRKVAAHAHGAQAILWASNAGVDSVEHASYIDDAAIAALKKNGTYMVPTLYLEEWFMQNAEKNHVPEFLMVKARAVMPAADRNIQHAIASGVKVAFGTDAAVYPHGLNARQFAILVKMGMTPLQSIQSATLNAADLVGWSDKIGSIEPGKWADIIAVDGDPLADVRALESVKFVLKGGAVVKNQYAK